MHAYSFHSTMIELESLETLTRAFQAFHFDIEVLMFRGHSGASLVELVIYFYHASFNVPHRDGAYISICLLLYLAFDSMEWPIPNPFMIDKFRM